jgi:hypothetical protein
MAYYVGLEVFADSITYPSYTVPSSGTWIVSGNCSVDNSVLVSSGQFAVFALNGSAIVSLWFNGDNGDIQPVFNTASGASFSGSGAGLFPTDGTAFDWRYELNLATGFCEIFIDSVSVYSKTVSAGIAGDVSGYVASAPTTRLNFGNEALCRLYSIDFGGTRAYDPNDYIGTGTNLPDNIGTADATTASAGMFVFYSSGTTAAITEVSQPFTDAIASTLIGSISAAITESSQPFTDSITGTVFGNLAAAITESSQPFTDAISATLTPFSGAISASITETAGLFTDSILATVIGNISSSITETSAAFTDSITANIAIEINSSIIELNFSFTDSLVASIPSQWVNVNPSVNNWTDGNTPTNPWTNLT